MQARAHGFADCLRQLQDDAALGRRLHDGAGEHVVRGLFERGAERQHFIGALSRRGFDGEKARAADGERPGLVEQHGVGARQRFERAAALDQDAAPGRLGDAGDEGNRRRQDERAGRGGDEHGEAANEVARDQPGDEGDRKRDGQEHQRIAVGEPHERRLGGLRRRHQAHDARIGAFAGHGRRGHVEGRAGVQRAAEGGRAFGLDHRDRFAGQRQFIDRRGVRRDHAVDRNDFAGPHQEPVADRNVADRHVLDAIVDAAMRDARRPIEQRAQAMLGARHGDVLEHVAAGIHQRHDGAGQRLAERQRGAHRHQRDRIDAEPPGQEVAQHRDCEAGDDRRGRQRPAKIGKVRPVREMRGNSRGQSRNGNGDERPAQDALKGHRLAPHSSGTAAICSRTFRRGS